MAGFPIIGNKKIIGIYKGDENKKPVKIQQVLANRNGSTQAVFCVHTAWGNITYSWADPYKKASYDCYATGVATATCDDCGELLTERVPTTETTSGGYYCNSQMQYQNRATFTQLANSTQTYTYRTGSYGSAHLSAYLSDWTTTKEPTCTEDGVKSRTCSACGDTITEAIPGTGHSYRVELVSSATCTEPAKYKHICTRTGCGYSEIQESGSALGHNYETTATNVLTSCLTQTISECSRCGDTKNELIEGTHNWELYLGGYPEIHHKNRCTLCGIIRCACGDPNCTE